MKIPSHLHQYVPASQMAHAGRGKQERLLSCFTSRSASPSTLGLAQEYVRHKRMVPGRPARISGTFFGARECLCVCVPSSRRGYVSVLMQAPQALGNKGTSLCSVVLFSPSLCPLVSQCTASRAGQGGHSFSRVCAWPRRQRRT